MSAPALPKEIYDKLISAGVSVLHIQWSGGSDEGYLEVDSDSPIPEDVDIDGWAYDAFCFSGAGDGHSYGENYEYHLKENKVIMQEWYYVHHEDPEVSFEMEVEE